jgi:putative flavoprotein involved in K+ transport
MLPGKGKRRDLKAGFGHRASVGLHLTQPLLSTSGGAGAATPAQRGGAFPSPELETRQSAFGYREGGKPNGEMNGATAEASQPSQATDDVELAVIGAGQAGLAIGYFLKRQRRRIVILERAGEIAPAWRERWDSLTLFTPRRFSALPGLSFPGDPDGYPSRDEVIAYLERYAETFKLPIELNSEVKRLEQRDTGRFRLEVEGLTISADQVVVATGPFQTPYVPKVAEKLAEDLFQRHAVGYRRPVEVPAGTLLVVGGGNTGFQIAKELSATRRVVLSVGSRQMPLPQRVLGRDLFWWLTKARILDKTVDSRLGQKLSTRDTLIGSSPRELKKRYGVELKPRVVDADGHTVRFEDGSEFAVDAVIWATGYRADYSWIKLPIFDEDGRLRHRRGVTNLPGLSFLGLTWQHTRGSALVGWVKDDAEFIAERIAEYQQSKAQPAAETPVGAGGTCPRSPA